jgi:hypothetical protein
MDLDRLEARQARAFRARPQLLGEARIIWRRRPIPLWDWIEQVLDEEEWDELGELEYWPGNVQALLDGYLHDVLHFYWDGLGPTSSAAGLQVLELGARGYLVYWNELESYQAVATLKPWQDDLVLSAAVKEILRKNGRPHGVELFGSVPTETTNQIPYLLTDAVVKQAYFDLLQWDDREGGDAWGLLAEEHFGRIVESDHRRRSLDILHRAAQAPDLWLEELQTEQDELDDTARQRLFDEWFETAYEVERRPV